MGRVGVGVGGGRGAGGTCECPTRIRKSDVSLFIYFDCMGCVCMFVRGRVLSYFSIAVVFTTHNFDEGKIKVKKTIHSTLRGSGEGWATAV